MTTPAGGRYTPTSVISESIAGPTSITLKRLAATRDAYGQLTDATSTAWTMAGWFGVLGDQRRGAEAGAAYDYGVDKPTALVARPEVMPAQGDILTVSGSDYRVVGLASDPGELVIRIVCEEYQVGR